MTIVVPPAPRPHWIARPRLLRRLVELPTPSTVLATAPAGWGKTTVFAQWHHHRHESRPFTWVRLEADDDVGSVGGVIDVVASSEGQPTTARVLVVEDLSPCRSIAERRRLARVLANLPSRVTLAVASRSPLTFPADDGPRGPVVRLGPDDLAFTGSEMHAVLRQVTCREVTADDVVLLRAWTEGWPAAVCVAAAAGPGTTRDGSPGPAQVLAGASEVRDYVTAEVLGPLDTETRDFLLATSVLDRLTHPLCAAVDPRPHTDQLLRRAVMGGLVVRDDDRGDHRHRGPVLDALRSELEAHHADRLPQLHRRAAWWHAREGSADQALQHAAASGDRHLLAALLGLHWPAHALGGDEGAVRAWLRACGDDVVRDPDLALAGVWLAGTIGDAGTVAGLLPVVRSTQADAPVAGFSSQRSAMALVQLFMAAVRPAALLADVDRAVREETAHRTIWQATAALAQGWVRHLTGRGGAMPAFERAAATAGEAQPAVRAEALAGASLVALADGHLDRARRLAEAAADVAAQHGLDRRPGAWATFVARGAAWARDGRHDEARVSFDTGVARAGVLATTCPWALATALERRDVHDVATRVDVLSEREHHVLRLLQGPLPRGELARELGVTTNTVKTHVRSVYRKLGASSRAEAVSRARHYGLL